MVVKMSGLYHIEDGRPAYYRKQGKHCFDFVNSRQLASDLTEQEADEVLEHDAYYLNMYGASKIEKED